MRCRGARQLRAPRQRQPPLSERPDSSPPGPTDYPARPGRSHLAAIRLRPLAVEPSWGTYVAGGAGHHWGGIARQLWVADSGERDLYSLHTGAPKCSFRTLRWLRGFPDSSTSFRRGAVPSCPRAPAWFVSCGRTMMEHRGASALCELGHSPLAEPDESADFAPAAGSSGSWVLVDSPSIVSSRRFYWHLEGGDAPQQAVMTLPRRRP